MSVRLLALIWPLHVAPTQKAVILALGDMASDTGYCCSAISRIADMAAVSQEEATRIIQALTDERWITATTDHLRGASPGRYQINERKLQAAALVKVDA